MTWGPLVRTPKRISHVEAMELREATLYRKRLNRLKLIAWAMGLCILLNECGQIGERVNSPDSIPAKNRQGD